MHTSIKPSALVGLNSKVAAPIAAKRAPVVGNQALLRGPQAKLGISEPSDDAEKEADRIRPSARWNRTVLFGPA